MQHVHELFPVQSRFAPAMFRATHSAIFSRLIRTLNLRIQEILKYIRADTHTSTYRVQDRMVLHQQMTHKETITEMITFTQEKVIGEPTLSLAACTSLSLSSLSQLAPIHLRQYGLSLHELEATG